MAFAYTVFPREHKQPIRLLRVYSLQANVATTQHEVYKSADEEVVLGLLTHKIVRSVLDEGINEGRLLLQDWMTILLANYNEYMNSIFGPKRGTVTKTIDTTFSKHTNIKHLTRFVFALLKNPLMAEETSDPDYWCYLHCLFT
jgi:hypothetical protein